MTPTPEAATQIVNEGTAAYDIRNLLPSQHAAAKRVILGIQEIAERESENRTHYASPEEYEWEQWGRRPQNVFFLDGARGSGKTFVLMSILNLARQLGRNGAASGRPNFGAFFQRLVGQSIQSLIRLQEEAKRDHSKPGKPVDFLNLKHFTRTALVLPTIFPVDNEGSGACMEVIFASIDRRLDQQLLKHDADKVKVEKLRKELVDMTRCWTFSRNLGLEALLSDSADYVDFVKKRAKQSRDSNLRIDAWRKFINKLCDAFGSALLVLGIDDTDVKPELTVDILHSLRIYLDHPRIVTVLAGNLRAMRQSLVYSKFAQLRSSVATIRDNPTTLKDWRRAEREEIEQYLEKVLPRWRRNFVGPSDARTAQNNAEAEWLALFGGTWDEVGLAMLNHYRAAYTAGRTLAALQYERLIHDRISGLAVRGSTSREWDSTSRAAVEHFMSWWLFRHSYAGKLQPSTVRQLISLHYFLKNVLPPPMGTATAPPGTVTPRTKRLSVILFECADNYLLSQRFDDNDKVITEWLCQQKVSASWTQQRWFKINGRRLSAGSYSYEAICFRIDLVFARPVRFHEDNNIPIGLLPKPAGIKSIAPFYGVDGINEAPYFGVAAQMNHAAIPRNCVYMSDLRVLPTASFEADATPAEAQAKGKNKSTWESVSTQNLLSLFGNDPRGKIMIYLNGWVAPLLRRSYVRHGPLSWLQNWGRLLLSDELDAAVPKISKTVEKKANLTKLTAEEQKKVADRNTWYTVAVSKPSESESRYIRERSTQYIARYLSLFASLRYAWSATAVFINGLEHSINHGKSISESDLTDREDNDLIVRGTLSQDISPDRYLFLDFNWLKEALKVVPWLSKQILTRQETEKAAETSPEKANEAASKRAAVWYHLGLMDSPTLATSSREQLEHDGGNSCWKNKFRELKEEDYRKVSEFYDYKRLLDDSTDAVVDARKARALRHFLLYLIGLHMSMPALIHVEVASTLGIGQERLNARREPNGKLKVEKKIIENARTICQRWREFAVGATMLVARMEIDAAIALRNATKKVHPELFEKNPEQARKLFSYAAWRHVFDARDKYPYPRREAPITFAPDISVSTLFGDPKEQVDAYDAPLQPGHTADSAAFVGLFQQARTNLWVTLRFLHDIQSELDELS